MYLNVSFYGLSMIPRLRVPQIYVYFTWILLFQPTKKPPGPLPEPGDNTQVCLTSTLGVSENCFPSDVRPTLWEIWSK